jgi:hypothetical protein
MGEISYQGDSPFRLIPAQATTASVSGHAVEMTVYVSVDRKPPSAFQIQIPMSSEDARSLAGQLTASAIAAESRQRRR